MTLNYNESQGMDWRGFSSPVRDKAPMVRRNLGLVMAAGVLLLMAAKLQPTPSVRSGPAGDARVGSLAQPIKPGAPDSTELSQGESPERNPVAEYLLTKKIAETWKVSSEMAGRYVRLAFTEGRERNVDPLLLLSIMAVESSFNPSAQSHKGAQGLMQVFRRWHQEKFEALGIPDNAHPTVRQNVQIGTLILKEYLDLSRNDVMQALQRYNGNAADPGQRYANKVINMHKEFRDTCRLSARATLSTEQLSMVTSNPGRRQTHQVRI